MTKDGWTITEITNMTNSPAKLTEFTEAINVDDAAGEVRTSNALP